MVPAVSFETSPGNRDRGVRNGWLDLPVRIKHVPFVYLKLQGLDAGILTKFRYARVFIGFFNRYFHLLPSSEASNIAVSMTISFFFRSERRKFWGKEKINDMVANIPFGEVKMFDF